MSNITAILVDDEISNLKGLEFKLERFFPEIEVIAAIQKPETAVLKITELQPDILFLDIEMPRMTGFELLSQLKDVNFQVIFVTAHSEFALEAFKLSAIDYVLKPIDNNDFKIAVNKTLHNIKLETDNTNNAKLVNLLTESSSKNNKLIIPTTKGISFIPQDEVLHLEGYDGYTKIHLNNDTIIMSSYNIGKFEKLLDTTFFKCHKSHIINLEKVRYYENEGYLVLDNNYRVPISRANKKPFLNLFS